jgi:Ulp1 family protease
MKEYLAMELKELWNEDEWTVLQKQRSTRQLNGSDCGVFTVLNALALLRGEEFTKVLACDGMREARERIAATLMAGVPTTELG